MRAMPRQEDGADSARKGGKAVVAGWGINNLAAKKGKEPHRAILDLSAIVFIGTKQETKIP
jgi:hypothetical protein